MKEDNSLSPDQPNSDLLESNKMTKNNNKPVEPQYLYLTGLKPLNLVKAIQEQKGGLDNFVDNPSCWICKRNHNRTHGTIQRMGMKGNIIDQELTVRYIDVNMHYGQIIRIPICDVCVLLVNEAAKKKVAVIEMLATHDEEVDNR